MNTIEEIAAKFLKHGIVLRSDFFLVTIATTDTTSLIFKFNTRTVGIYMLCEIKRCADPEGIDGGMFSNTIYNRSSGKSLQISLKRYDEINTNMFAYQYTDHVRYDSDFDLLTDELIKFITSNNTIGNKYGTLE